MRSGRVFAAVDSHTEGMPTRVITAGLGTLPGGSMQERRLYFEQHLDDLRTLLMREPRGHAAMSGAFLQPPTRPDADWGVLFIEVSGCLPMCGHGTIGVATVLVECGMVAVSEPETVIRLDTPAGLVEARVAVADGRAERVTLRNVPAFAVELDARVEVDSVGVVTYDPPPRSIRSTARSGAASTSSSTCPARTAPTPGTPRRFIPAGLTALPAGPAPRRGWRPSTPAGSSRSAPSS